MATYESAVASAKAIEDNMKAIDLKLDAIRAWQEAQTGGGVVTQEQLDALAGLLGEAKTHSDAVKDEAEALSGA